MTRPLAADDGAAQEQAWALWTAEDPPFTSWSGPPWTEPAYDLAKTVMFMAMCADAPAPGVDDDLVVPLMDTAVAIGRHATTTATVTVAARCGLTLLAGHAVARTQHALATGDRLLAEHLRRVTCALWPTATTAQPPGPAGIRAALDLNRHVRTFGDDGVPYLAELITLGTASGDCTTAGGTYAAALRALLRRTITPGSAVAKARFSAALHEQVRALVQPPRPAGRHSPLTEMHR
ncbi:hypothetical protein [Streptosporangium canum]|uniref:hypothetical protein n=1 Tax=Streptosporangium canum TaxID=324952 RepID=UPI00379E4D41